MAKLKTGKIISLCAIGLLTAVVTAANIVACGTKYEQLITDYLVGFKTADQETLTANRQGGEKLANEIETEGIVLLKNENNTLPLSVTANNKVNVFGWSSTQWIGGGSGSGRVVDNGSVTIKEGLVEALEKYDIETNQDLQKMYKSFQSSRPGYSTGTLNTHEYQFYRLVEPDIDSDYSTTLLDDASEFSDTAFVVIGRVAGESSDPTKEQFKGSGNSSTPNDKTRTYLDISTEEEKLLTYVGENYENVVVIVNSTNTMNLGFMDTIPGLDACLMVGATGTTSADAIPYVLYGEDKDGNKVSPSGHLVDTYAYDFKTNPSYFTTANVNNPTLYAGIKQSDKVYPYGVVTNPNVGDSSQYPGVAYVDYNEGVYVGYKWYETADVEGYWDSIDNEYGKGYEGVVQYPFGYGMSYTSFDWDIVDISKANHAELGQNDTITVKVAVTNTGTVAGKDVVELYYTPEYKKGQIEKSAVNLGAFAKTTTLEPGKTQTLELSLDVRDMASYDYNDANKNGFSGYELDQGNYSISLRTDAHTLKEMKSGSNTYTYNVSKNIQYKTDDVTGNAVNNKFTGTDTIDGVGIDGSDTDQDITWLTRADFDGTFPEEKPTARSMPDEVKALNLYTSAMANEYDKDNDPGEAPTFGKSSNGIKLYEGGLVTEDGLQLGKDYDDPLWDDVLDQISLNDATQLALHGYCQTKACDSIGKVRTNDCDGPNQIGSFNKPQMGIGYPNETTTAQTWNKSLGYNLGLSLAKEAKGLGYDGWYGPACNMHRSPFGGRNYEYFSEDALISGVFTAEEVRGAKNAGVYAYLKHLALYEQETYRDALYTWVTEQALREVYLKPFEIAIKEGGANAIMSSYNRIGAVWTGGSKALIDGVLRQEWGFRGCILTDYADHQQFMSGDHMIRSGGDLWMDGYQSNGSFKFSTTSNTFKTELRRATKNTLYMVLNTAYVNSQYNADADVGEKIEVGAKVETNPIVWEKYVFIGDTVVYSGLIVWALFTLGVIGKKKPEIVSGE